MAIKTCTGTTSRPFVHVQARLSQPCTITATGLDAPLVTDATGLADGTYSIQLWAASDLTPTGTFQTVTEFLGSTDNTFNVQVPNTAGPFPMSSILVGTPTASPSPNHVSTLIVDGTSGVAINAAGDIAGRSLSLSASGPYTPTAAAGAIEASATSATVAMLGFNQTITGVKTFSAAPIFNLGATFPSSAGVVAMGSGDDVSYYVNGAAWEMTSQQGTAGGPITTGTGPNVKISRTESITEASMPGGVGANNQGNAGLWASAKGDALNEAQVSGLLGTAINLSTQSAHNDDACGVQGLGSIQGSGTGKGIGGYFAGRRDTNTGTANGVEARVSNFTATNGTYNATGSSDTMGIWVTAGGNASVNSGVGLAFGPGNGTSQFDVGIGFTTLSGVSAIATTSIRDDSTSANSILINGTHTVGIGVGASAGPVLVGGTTQIQSPSLLEVQGPNASTDPLVVFGSVGNNQPYTLRIRNSSGQFTLGVATAGAFFTGTLAGDGIITASTTGKAVHLGGTTKVISVTRANTFGAFAATPVAQQATTGTTTGFTAGAGTAMNSASSSTGGSGSTAYTFGDLVLALKNYGWLAA